MHDMLKQTAKAFNKSVFRPLLNVGCLMDIPTGRYYTGKHGESILSGGHPNFLGIGGKPNTYKSQLAHYLNLTLISRYNPLVSLMYDTEGSLIKQRFIDLANGMDELDGSKLFDEDNPLMLFTDSSVMGNTYYENLKDHCKAKLAHRKTMLRFSPFIDKDGDYYNVMNPTVVEIDSMSQFTFDAIEDQHDNNEAGSAKLNTEAMNAARFKSQIISQIPNMTARANMYLSMTAHVGKELKVDQYSPSGKTLPFMPAGLVFKRVPENFSFLTNLTYYTHSPTPMLHDDKTCRYPISTKDTYQNDVDLQKITVIPWRAKSGATGHDFELVFSQKEGLKVGLSEFEHLRRKKNRNVGNYKYTMAYGVSGSNVTRFNLELMPEVTLTRTTLRKKIDESYKLRRALAITSEMQQLMSTWNLAEKYICSPAELHEDIKKLGYDWDVLLETRGFWIFNDMAHERNYLSTMDLLKMRVGEYRPYWMDSNNNIKVVKTSKTRAAKTKASA